MAASSKRSPSPLVIADGSYYPNPRYLEIYRRSCSDIFQRPSIRKVVGIPPHHHGKDPNAKVVGVPPHHHGKDPNAKALPASTDSLCLRLKLISLFLFLLLVGCLWTPITDSPLVSFTKLNEPVSHFSVKESNNTVSHFLMLPTLKQLGNLHFCNFTNSVKEQTLLWPMKEMGIGIVQLKEANFSMIESLNHFSMIPNVKQLRNLHFCNFTNSVKEQNLLWPMKEMRIGIVPLKQANFSMIESLNHFSMIPNAKQLRNLHFCNFTNSVKEQNLLWPMKEMGIGIVQLKEANFSMIESVNHFSMIPNVKQLRNLHFCNFTNSVKEQNLLWPIKEMGIGIVQLKEANFSMIESLNHFSMIVTMKQLRDLHFCNFTNSVKEQNLPWPMKEMGIGIVQLKEAKAVASHTDHEKASQGKTKSKLIPHGALVSEFEPKAEAHCIIIKTEQKAQVLKASVIKSEMPPIEKLYGENKLISNAEVESSIVVSEHESSELENSQSLNELHLILKEKSYAVNFLWISLLFLILAVTAFIFAKQLTVCSSSMPTASMENTHQGRLSSRNWLTEVDMVGELCPSEMGSFQWATSYSKQESKGASEAQSQERGPRKSHKRESLTSSEYSISSPSYGSYTSYEKIHSKQVPKSNNDSEFLSETIADQFLSKKLPSMPTASVKNTHQESLCSRNWPTKVDMVDESCPSEMSSFQRTTSYPKRGSNGASSTLEYSLDSSSYSKKESKGASEAQSQERGLRKSSKRESLASSSEYSKGSTSYGSYTSYEKISHKHGRGGQEVVIQVRRSCRIRNQIASS